MNRALMGMIAAVSLACSGSSKSPKPDGGSVSVSPSTASVIAGGPLVTFKATGSSSVAWSLNPSVGSLTSYVGSTTGYLPPPPTGFTASQTVTLTATIVNTAVSASAVITVSPYQADAGPPGTLHIDISNTVSGQTPAVFATGDLAQAGPFSVSTDVSLPAGPYWVYGQAEALVDSIVGGGIIPSITGSPVQVATGQTVSVSVDYGAVPNGATGRLWLPVCSLTGTTSGSIFGLASATLHMDGGPVTTGDIRVNTDGGCAEGVAFDSTGRMWVADFADGVNGKLWGFTFADDGGVTAPIVITITPDGGGPGSAQALAFAPNGDLWVANNADSSGMGQLIRYTSDQLQASGAPTPASVVTSSVVNGYDSIFLPVDLLFSSDGALWLLNSGNDTIVKFANLGSLGVSSAPSFVIFDDGSNWIDLNGGAFDSRGNLWVAGKTTNSVVELNLSSIDAGVGAVQASAVAVLSTLDGGRTFPFNGVSNLAFDASGNLWVINSGDSTVVEFSQPSAFSGRTAPVPLEKFTGSPTVDLGRMQFDPPGPGMGLYP